jgi:pilus assembly protein CpaF
MEADVITLQDLFEFKVDAVASDRTISGRLYATGLRPIFLHKFQKHGIDLPVGLFAVDLPLGLRGEAATR